MNVKMGAGILLVCVVASIFFVAPIQAYFNGTAKGDVLQTQEREQLRIQEHTADRVMLQTQKQERLRIQSRDCACNCTQTQSKQGAEECCRNRTCTEAMNMEQTRNQHREGK